MKWTVYVRVSTDKEEQKSSLENQQCFLYNILSEKGWELYRFYVDVESGTKQKKRENLRQLIEDAKQKKSDVVLAKELSRLARNEKLSYEINVKRSELEASLLDNDITEQIEKLRGILHRFLPFNEVTNELLHYFVERIDVKKDGTPIIKYRYSILDN